MAAATERARNRRRLTLRARLTLSYAGLVTGCGAVLIALVYLYMRFVPSYQLLDFDQVPDPSEEFGSSGATTPRPEGIAIQTAEDFLENLLLASGIALLLLAFLGGFVGWMVAGRIIKPLREISTAARLASTGALDHRIGLDGPRDEIRDLADTVDLMLASLERSFNAHRRFTANASHELRTPLATTKTMVDVTLADPDVDAAQLRALAERVSEVNQSSIETVDALLDLTAADATRIAREPVDLAAVVRAAVRDLAAEAVRRHVTVVAPTGSATVPGSPVLIRQAVANLVRNAVRHNHPDGRVEVRTEHEGDAVRLVVANTGPLVDPGDVARLVEPFARGGGRSLTRGSGHGIGLAVVAAVVTAHDGALTLVANHDGGLTVTMALPRTVLDRPVYD